MSRLFGPTFIFWALASCQQSERTKPDIKPLDRPESLAMLTDDVFTGRPVDCKNGDDKLAQELWAKEQATLSNPLVAKLVGFGSTNFAYKGGTGQLVSIVYEFSPGDPGAVTTAQQDYLVSENCRTALGESSYFE